MIGGTLGLDSVEGEGSSFWFTAKLETAAEKPVASLDAVASNEGLQLNARILLVEDNPVNQMVAQKMLERIGLKATLANNGVEALQCLDEQSFDLVLMDCQVPDMDGLDATREIWKLELKTAWVQRLPIIVLTANVMSGDRERCLETGMDDYIGKPVQRDQLATVLRKWLA